MYRLNLFICLVSSICSVYVYSQSDWDYNLLRFEYNTSNPEVIDVQLRFLRSTSNNYAINGTLNIGDDIDDRYSASVKIYRSPTGTSHYRETPFCIAKTNFYSFMTNVYVKMLQSTGAKCSNLPVHEKKFDTPLAKGIYNLNMCIISNEKMPLHMQPGFYRITVYFEGPNAYSYMSGFTEVQQKSLG